MKKFIFMAIAIFSIIAIACQKEITTPNEIDGLKKVQAISNDTNTIEIYTKKGSFQLGYNNVYLRVKNNTTSQYATDVTFDWTPLMHMMHMTHSCPKSIIKKVDGKETLYQGYIVFQMPENASEHWTLQIKYQTNGKQFTVEDTIAVPNSTRKVVTSFTGTDANKYILALIEPETPQVAINDFKVGLFSRQDMMNFPVVKNYSIDIDPRMPSMGNHGSPNNENLIYQTTDSLYQGKASFTMSGYWKINLILKNASNDTISGNAVTSSVESSNLFLEVEF